MDGEYSKERFRIIAEYKTDTPNILRREEYACSYLLSPKIPELDGDNIQCKLADKDNGWLYIRDVKLGLPAGFTESSDIRICNTVSVVEDDRVVLSKSNCFIIDDNRVSKRLRLMVKYNVAGIIGDLEKVFTLKLFTHRRDAEVPIIADTEDGIELFLFYTNLDLERVKRSFVYHTAYLVKEAKIIDAWDKTILKGNDMCLMVSKHNLLDNDYIEGRKI